MKKIIILFTLTVFIAGCSATPTRRSFKENWRDTTVTSKVKWRMARDKDVQAHNIDVDTWRGVVTLTGRAASEGEKSKAEEIAKNTKNVKEVRNYLDVVGGAKENIAFSKPAGKYAEPSKIALPAAAPELATVVEKDITPPAKAATETRERTKQAPRETRQNGVSYQIGKEMAKDDITLQAERELKELKTEKSGKEEPKD